MFSGSPASLFIGVVLSAFGAGYLMYAKRAASVPALACGLALLLFPLFGDSPWTLAVAGGALVALPFVGGRLGWW